MIYRELMQNEIEWIGLADREAGILDDLVLGLTGRVVGHQFKSSLYPTRFSVDTLLLGAEENLKALADSWSKLVTQFGTTPVEARFVTTDFPTDTDHLLASASSPDHSAAFVAEFRDNPTRSLADWRSSRWAPFVQKLQDRSGLEDPTFERFMHSFKLVCGHQASFLAEPQSEQTERGVREIAQILPQLIATAGARNRWSRDDFLSALRWPDDRGRRRSHKFPIGAFVQRNPATERALLEAIASARRGYVSLLGPPGSGKSTLIQMGLEPSPDRVVVRYFAFLPGEGHGLGRAEAEDFLTDVNRELRASGLKSLRYYDADLRQMREHFEHYLKLAGERFEENGVATTIVVDGLDHIPREETPERSLLRELPLPASLPEGVVLVLGTQHLKLEGLPKQVAEEASQTQRAVSMQPLSKEAIIGFADDAGLDADIDRGEIYKLSQGHPLAARYLIEALKASTSEQSRNEILKGKFDYQGDIGRVYDAAWRDIDADDEVRRVLAFVARVEGSIEPEHLATLVNRGAVERAFKATGHLLSTQDGRWRVFHNSLRLYLLSKEERSFGKKDQEHDRRIYTDLAELTQKVDSRDPQKWLELRYRARANQLAEVSSLATPEYFRTQLAEGRPARDIQADIRLAFAAIAPTQNIAQLVRLLLARHEISMRADALQYADGLADAYLALGELDAARGLIDDGISRSKAYDILDAYVETGRTEEARRLFDDLGPLSDKSTNYPSYSDLVPWARRVFQFRQPDQIRTTLDRLSKPRGDNDWHKQEARQLADNLRFDIALATVNETPSADVDAICKDLAIDASQRSYLRLQAALAGFRDNDTELASKYLRELTDSGELDRLPNGWRRAAALLALRLNDIPRARKIYGALKVPPIENDESSARDSLKSTASTVLEHASLAAALDEPPPTFAPARHQITTAFQAHLATLGALRGAARRGDTSNALGLIAVCENLLTFLNNVSADDSGTAYEVSKILTAAPTLLKVLLHVSRLYGPNTHKAIVAKIIDAMSEKTGNLRSALGARREIIEVIFNESRDAESAATQLEAAYKEITNADTPTEQVNEIAAFAKSFAHIGEDARARAILADVPAETLGYQLAPKKDPQYVFWRDAFLRACEADPSKRLDKITFFTRLLVGMGKTEGRSTAYRLTSALLDQAALEGPEVATSVARALEHHSLISWVELVDSILRGISVRRPDLIPMAVQAWVCLVLPYYKEPFYQEGRLGGFITTAMAQCPTTRVDELVALLLRFIEAQSVDTTRIELLEKLRDAAAARGIGTTVLERALRRWRKEIRIKPESSGDSPDPLSGATSLDEIASRLDKAGSEPDYRATDPVIRLVEKATAEAAEEFLAKQPTFSGESRVLFSRTRAALAAGEPAKARALLKEYQPEKDSRASWNGWMGGSKLEHARLRVELDGAPARRLAFTQFAHDLAQGRESILSLITDLEDVIGVLAEKPNWPELWEILQEFLTQFRDYRLGEELVVASSGLPKTEEQLLAWIYEQAFSLRVSDLAYQARVGAISTAGLPGGVELLEHLVTQLLAQPGEGPLEAAGLLYHSRNNPAIADKFRGRVGELAAHPDFAVRLIAEQLARDWSMQLTSSSAPLPGFYSLAFQNEEDGERYEPTAKVDGLPETAWISNPLDWTWPLEFQIGLISDASGISHMHIRQRCAQIITAAGGVQKYGPATEKSVRRRPERLGMALTYKRPVLSAAIQSLRRVVGELDKAGKIDKRAVPYLLNELASPATRDTLLVPAARPTGLSPIRMDDISFATKEESWLDQVQLDLRPTDTSGDTLLAEVALFQERSVIRTATAMRLRLHSLAEHDWDDLDDGMRVLPSVIDITKPIPTSSQPSPYYVRRLRNASVSGPPEHLLVLCPLWARRLGWTQHPSNPLIYRDCNGTVMSTTVWWRDGGPRHAKDDVRRAEGSLVILTAEGERQLTAISGPLKLITSCVRQVGREGDDAPPFRTKRARTN